MFKSKEKGKTKIENPSNFDKTLDLDNSEEKRNSKKNVSIIFYVLLYCTVFLVIPMTTLYDEYIDWPNLTERKKEFRRILKFAKKKILLAKH